MRGEEAPPTLLFEDFLLAPLAGPAGRTLESPQVTTTAGGYCGVRREASPTTLLFEGFLLLAPLACLTLESPQVTTTAGYCAAKRRQHWCLKTYCWPLYSYFQNLQNLAY